MESNITPSKIQESSQWQFARAEVLNILDAYTIENLTVPIDNAMWEAYKLGYIRYRQEILDIDDIVNNIIRVRTFAMSSLSMNYHSEAVQMVTELTLRLKTEPKFKP